MTPRWVAAVAVAVAFALLACATPESQSAAGVTPMRVSASLVQRTTFVAGPVRIEVSLRTSTRGTYTMTGTLADTGSVTSGARVVNGRLRLVQSLTGSKGTIRIRVLRSCAGTRGTWMALGGSDSYARLRGQGAVRGGPRCSRAVYPVRAVYTGSVRVPDPPPLAKVGEYGGSTAQREAVVFEVLPGGRAVAGFRLERFTLRCSPRLSLLETITLPGPYALEADGSFAAQVVLQSGLIESVTGRITADGAAAGSARIAGTVTDPIDLTRLPCEGSLAWTASSPPPSAQPGKYCGFTERGPGICLDVADGGRAISGFVTGVIVPRCQPAAVFEITITFAGAIPIGPNLGFRKFGLAIEGLTGGTGSISGLFESAGTASGSVGLSGGSFEHEGTRYQCTSAGSNWRAARQP